MYLLMADLRVLCAEYEEFAENVVNFIYTTLIKAMKSEILVITQMCDDIYNTAINDLKHATADNPMDRFSITSSIGIIMDAKDRYESIEKEAMNIYKLDEIETACHKFQNMLDEIVKFQSIDSKCLDKCPSLYVRMVSFKPTIVCSIVNEKGESFYDILKKGIIVESSSISTTRKYEHDLYIEIINIDRVDGIPITIKVAIPKKHSYLLNITNIFNPYETALFCINFEQYSYDLRFRGLKHGGSGEIIINKAMIDSGVNVDITFGNKNLTVHESK